MVELLCWIALRCVPDELAAECICNIAYTRKNECNPGCNYSSKQNVIGRAN